MNKLSAARRSMLVLVILVTSGCEALSEKIAEHPKATAVIGSVLITSGLLIAKGHSSDHRPEVGVALPDCKAKPESCK